MLKDDKVEIIRIMHYPDYPRVMGKLIEPYLTNEEGHYIIPRSELLPEEIWDKIIHNKLFEWGDIELMYKDTFVDDKYIYGDTEDN